MREYFDSAKRWYYFKYVSHIKFLIFIASITILMILLASFVFYVVQSAIAKQKRVVKVVTVGYNFESKPTMTKIEKPYYSNDINILQYSIESYLNNFEVYDKTDNFYVAFIEKMKHLQKYSSRDVMKVFQDKFTNDYSKRLKTNAFVKMQIKSIRLNISEESLIDKFRNLLMAQGIPDQATIEAIIYIFDGNKLEKSNVTIEMEFVFKKIQRQENDKFTNIKFFVTSYAHSGKGIATSS
jgi:hypothetical protein